MGARDVVAVHPARVPSVQVEEAGAWLAEIPGRRRQERARAHRVAAVALPLEALAEPEERGPVRVDVRRLLDQRRRDAGRVLAPCGRTGSELGLELLPADGVRGEEAAVEQPVPADHVQEREGERRVASRERLQMEIGGRCRVGPDRVDDDHRARGLGEPVLVGVRRGGGRVGAPDEDARRIRGRARVEAVLGGPVDVLERDVTGLVADRVRIDLGGAEAVEEALREAPWRGASTSRCSGC